MYTPKNFQVTDLGMLHDFMQKHSFATLISNADDGMVASHLPLLLDRETRGHGKLIGHMARANSHWQTAAGKPVLAIFHGPHAYISPSWYEATNVVPTWNYVTVHAYGVLKPVEDRDQLYNVIQRTVNLYESNMPTPWSMQTPAREFIEKLLESIVGFEITIDRLEGKWKLSQNHSVERQEKVIQGLYKTGNHNSACVADLMTSSLRSQSDAES